MRNLLLFLHIAAAIIIVGSLIFMDMVVPGMVRGGADNLPTMRKLHKLSGVFGPASGLVFLLGLALVLRQKGDGADFDDTWVSLSMLLFIVAAVIGSVLGAKTLRSGIDKLESGQSADAEAGRLSMFGGINVLVVLVIVWLMVDKPGITS
jgi:uncharacterized membrane protein